MLCTFHLNEAREFALSLCALERGRHHLETPVQREKVKGQASRRREHRGVGCGAGLREDGAGARVAVCEDPVRVVTH